MAIPFQFGKHLMPIYSSCIRSRLPFKLKPPSRTTRLYKQIESAPSRIAFGPPYLHQHNPICDTSSSAASTLHMRPTNGTPNPHQNTILTPEVSDPLPCFGVPVSVFCTNQTPLFYSFGKCTKTANDSLRHFTLIFHLFSHGSSPPSPLVEVFHPPCTHHYDNHSWFTPTLEVLPTPRIFPLDIPTTAAKLLKYTSTSGH